MLKTCRKEDDFEDKKPEEKGADPTKGFSLDSDSEADLVGMEIDVACLDEKSAAVNSIGYMFKNAPNTCKAVMPDILEALEHL